RARHRGLEQLLPAPSIQREELPRITALKHHVAGRDEISRATDVRLRWMFMLPYELARGRIVGRHSFRGRNPVVLVAGSNSGQVAITLPFAQRVSHHLDRERQR